MAVALALFRHRSHSGHLTFAIRACPCVQVIRISPVALIAAFGEFVVAFYFPPAPQEVEFLAGDFFFLALLDIHCVEPVSAAKGGIALRFQFVSRESRPR